MTVTLSYRPCILVELQEALNDIAPKLVTEYGEVMLALKEKSAATVALSVSATVLAGGLAGHTFKLTFALDT